MHHHHHDHDHDHHHHHHHSIELDKVTNALLLGIVLNTVFVLIEGGAGYYYSSLALISDAGHNLSDVASLLIALLAFKVMSIEANKQFTYGYKKVSILAAFLNALILCFAIGFIVWESVQRFNQPVEIHGGITAGVAAVGIVINTLTALLFLRDKDKDINLKGAYLHMLIDALISVGVVLGGGLIYWTKFYWIDTALSLGIVFFILSSTWSLLKESWRLTLNGLPSSIDFDEIQQQLQALPSVQSVHHLHIWALSTSENALTAHLVVNAGLSLAEASALRHKAKAMLKEAQIGHVTIEIEEVGFVCEEEQCSTEILTKKTSCNHQH